MVRLNLGCGRDIREGYINTDYFKAKGVDKLLDLNKFPYPFPKDFAEEIIMQDIFEHLEDPIKVLEEIFRIAKDKAIIKIRVPHFSSGNTWGDLTHKRGFSSTVFNNYSYKETSSLEKNRKVKVKIKKIKLFFPTPYRFLGFNYLFSRFILIYERIFYGFFPCGNISFELEVDKTKVL